MFGGNKALKILLSEFPHHSDSSHPTEAGIWAPSDLKVLHRVFEKLNLKPHYRFLDAGSGDGRVAFLATLFCDEVVAIEADPTMHFIATRKLEKYPFLKGRLVVLKDDYLNHNFSAFDIIFSHADGEVTEEFREKCMKEMRPGAMAIFYAYHPSLPNTKVIDKKIPIWLFEK
jgi:protein-L-isoaspartate O-methyltransferase